MSRALLFIVLLLAALPGLGQGQRMLRLEDCYQLALDRNLALKRSQQELSLRMLDRNTARHDLLPSLSYSVNHFFSFGKNIDPVTNNFVTERFSGGDTGLQLQLDLFSGFKKLHAIKQAGYGVQAASFARKNTELELLSNVTLAYSRLLFNKEQAAVVRSNLRTTALEMRTVAEKIKAGRLTKYEQYTFNARLSSEQAELVTAQNDSLAALQELRQLLNLPHREQVQIAPIDTSQLAGIYHSPLQTQELLDTLLRQHPAVKQAQVNEQVARSGVKVAKSSLAPTLSARGNLSSNYNSTESLSETTPLPLKRQLNDNLGQYIGLSLEVPIFSKRELSNTVKKEKLNLATAMLQTKEVENLVVSQTLQLVNEFNAAKQKYQATRTAWEQNKLSYSLYQEKHRLGQVSSVELFTARDILNASSARFIQAKLELYFRHRLLLLLKEQ
ncbi:MAG: TolC family protein [Adhaeribacter sp.]